MIPPVELTIEKLPAPVPARLYVSLSLPGAVADTLPTNVPEIADREIVNAYPLAPNHRRVGRIRSARRQNRVGRLVGALSRVSVVRHRGGVVSRVVQFPAVPRVAVGSRSCSGTA